jgi:GNAT superfamily N-acetyltransferase
MTSPTGPTADVSVRIGWADDARGIAEVQVAAWRATYADLLPDDELAAMDVDQFAAGWHGSLTRSNDARNRVLVALERNRIVGYAIVSPASDPDCDPVADGELSDFTVLPSEQRKGHGSRLQQAAIDTLVADRFTRAVTWLNATDDALHAFLTDAGWSADQAHRELDLYGDGSVTVKQIRLHTGLV